MSQYHDKDELLEEELEREAEELVSEFEEQEEMIESQKTEIAEDEGKIAKLQDALARSQADFDNFKKRTERDKDDMVFFLKLDIFKKILPRLDDLERMIRNTPEGERNGALYEGILSMQKSLLKDLEKLGVRAFESKGQELNPDLHEVMTQVPGEEGIVVDEFEKGYMLGERVLRVAKVVVGSGDE
ncbi:nucleotide exchange factor GrpE [Candidatus Gracilibacteria bacterium]|nr:nucleotide exchange factor GrpE [Candidatus Gracilibacteria bacterium]